MLNKQSPRPIPLARKRNERAGIGAALGTWQRRRAGKIAHLPQTVRDQINVLLQDASPEIKLFQSNSRIRFTQGHSAAKPHQTRKLRSEKRTATREAYGVRRIPALWIYFMDKNEKRRDAAHSIRFALLDAFLISQAQESTLPA